MSPFPLSSLFRKVGIERTHRGKFNEEENNKKHKEIPIYVKFESWKTSEAIKSKIIKANREGSTNVIVTQMYSKTTTEKMNEKLKIRKDILKVNKSWKLYVKYPGTLMVKKPGQTKFSIDEYQILDTTI